MRRNLLPKITSTAFGSEAKKLHQPAQLAYRITRLSLSQAVLSTAALLLPFCRWKKTKKKPNQQTHPLKSTQEISDEAGLAYLPVQHVQYPLYNFKREGASW